MKLMTFHLEQDTYAVELSTVVEVVRARAGAAAGGRRVVDLADRLGVQGGTAVDGPAVVLRAGSGESLLRVGRLGEVIDVADGSLRSVPERARSPLVRGVAEVGDALVVLLDAERLLAGEAE